MVDRLPSKRSHGSDQQEPNGRFKPGNRLAGNRKDKPNKIPPLLAQELIETAVAYGYDGTGKGGLRGYLRRTLEKHNRDYNRWLGRLIPRNDSLDVAVSGGIGIAVHIGIAPVSSGSFLLPDGRLVSETEAAHSLRHAMPPPLPPSIIIDNTLDDDANGDDAR